MGPQRKQQMLDDARQASPDVATAYNTLDEVVKNHPDPYQASPSIRREILNARAALKAELAAYGLNRFDSRVLSEFPGSETALAR